MAVICELTPDLYHPEFPQELIGENYGIAVNYKASDLLEQINQTIEQLNKNNQLDKMIKNHQSYYSEIITI